MTQERIVEEEVVDVEDNGNSDDQTDIPLDGLSEKKIGEGFEKPNLDGEVVTITNVELKATNDERTTKDGSKKYRPVIFRVHYDDKCYENYGGVAQFKHEGEYGEPTIWVDGKSKAAKLFKLWLKHKAVSVEDVSFKEFFTDLKGKKAKLKSVTVEYDDKPYQKNLVGEFVDF